MTVEEALQILAQVCAAMQADLATHQRVQTALSVVHDALRGPLTAVPSED